MRRRQLNFDTKPRNNYLECIGRERPNAQPESGKPKRTMAVCDPSTFHAVQQSKTTK